MPNSLQTPRTINRRTVLGGALASSAALAVGEVVREHAPLRVVVGRGGRPLLEQRLVPALQPLLCLPHRRDDLVPPAHAGTLRPGAHARRSPAAPLAWPG